MVRRALPYRRAAFCYYLLRISSPHGIGLSAGDIKGANGKLAFN
jgi:hypothetical protein